ncbi:MAG TPA: gluconate 2-dehydrogenase subunit 3 family protein [Chloroflexota bacterium]
MVDDPIALTSGEANLLTAVLDTLLPGGEGFPSASGAGTGVFLLDQIGPGARQEWLLPLLTGLDDAAGGDFTVRTAEQRTTLLQQCEAVQPLPFARLLALAYYSYYAQPAVIAVIQALGHDYNQTPQPLGYAMAPFDPVNPTHLPAVPRGTYKRTLDMARVVMP